MTDESESATWQETISGDGGPRFVRGDEDLTLGYLTALEHQSHRVPVLVVALEAMLKEYAGAMSDEYDFPGSPWTPERGCRRDGSVPDTAYIEARAALIDAETGT